MGWQALISHASGQEHINTVNVIGKFAQEKSTCTD